jgi:hypothetical protein
MVTVVMQMHQNITLYVHCLSCLYYVNENFILSRLVAVNVLNPSL